MCRIVFMLLAFAAGCSGSTDFSTASSVFSATIYKKLTKHSSNNFLVSPLSAQTILALTHAGSKGDTEKELRSLFNFTDNAEEFQKTFENVIQSLSSKELVEFNLANKIYVKNGFSIRPQFENIVVKNFKADIENINFDRPQKAAELMNSWVEKQTNNKIQNLVSASNINDRTRLFLINALYFKANWSKTFPVAYTKKYDFHISANEKVPVDTMFLHDKTFSYFENEDLDARFVKLPFKDQDFSMVIVLPNKVEGLGRLEKQMRKVLQPQAFTSEMVNIALPKFRIESSTNLKKVFKNMGVYRSFNKKFADFSGIAGSKGDLVIDKINQKTFIDVREEGVEGGAATYLLMAIPMSAHTPKHFKVDRPFIFYIKAKDAILFVGRVKDPRPKQ